MTAPRLAIGIDLGETRLRAALVADNGSIVQRAETATLAKSGSDAVLGQIEMLARQVAAAVGAQPVCGLGLFLWQPGMLGSLRFRFGTGSAGSELRI